MRLVVNVCAALIVLVIPAAWPISLAILGYTIVRSLDRVRADPAVYRDAFAAASSRVIDSD